MVTSSAKLNDGLSCNIYGGEIERWLTSVLGVYATLARRTADSQMTLANEGAFLLVHEESVRKIRSDMAANERVTHERFRPNLVLDKRDCQHGYAAYSEDAWKRLAIGNENPIVLETMGLCQRCTAVNVDPLTGNNQSHLFTRLQTERREANTSRAHFGILLNLVNAHSPARIRVGDRAQAFK